MIQTQTKRIVFLAISIVELSNASRLNCKMSCFVQLAEVSEGKFVQSDVA